jgi:hypothetical protein
MTSQLAKALTQAYEARLLQLCTNFLDVASYDGGNTTRFKEGLRKLDAQMKLAEGLIT